MLAKSGWKEKIEKEKEKLSMSSSSIATSVKKKRSRGDEKVRRINKKLAKSRASSCSIGTASLCAYEARAFTEMGIYKFRCRRIGKT